MSKVNPKMKQWRSLCLALILISAAVFDQNACAGDDLSKTALSIAPQDAAFFSTSVNMRDAWNDWTQSKLVARLRAVPFIQELEQEFQRQWENPQGQLAQAKAGLQNPNVRNLLKLVQDMFDEEMFVYGGNDWCEALEGLSGMQNEISGRMSGGPEAMQQYFERLSQEDVDKIRIPTTVMGFRLSDPDSARIQLDALEGILRIGGSQAPQAEPFLQRLKRSDFKDGQTLSLSLDVGLIPLDAIDDEDGRRVAEKVVELLEGRSLTFGIGIKGNLLLLAVGENKKVVEEVGANESKLIDHEVFAVLKEQAPTNLRSIGYASQRLKESNWNANLGQYFQRITSQFNMAVSTQAERMPDYSEWQRELTADAKWMDGQIMQLTPNFGASVSWSRAMDDGAEGYTYDWTENALENGAPLAVTSHAGTDPLLMIAFKQKEIPGATELVEKLLEKIPGHVKRFLELAEDDGEERARVITMLDGIWPIVEEAFAIMRDKIGPSLAGNESLFTMSADWTTSVLGPNMPPPDRALPLPEFGIACKLADRDLFIEGCDDLYQLADRVVALVRENEPGSIPVDYSVPRPREDETAGGTKYFYSELSNALPLEGFEPQLVVGNDAIVLGYSERQVRDLSESKPLGSKPAWLTQDTPAAAVSYVDFAGMVEAVRPWIAYGLSFSGQAMDEPLSPQPGPIPTGNDVLQIWDCFKSAGIAAATVTVSDAGPTITRWVWVGE